MLLAHLERNSETLLRPVEEAAAQPSAEDHTIARDVVEKLSDGTYSRLAQPMAITVAGLFRLPSETQTSTHHGEVDVATFLKTLSDSLAGWAQNASLLFPKGATDATTKEKLERVAAEFESAGRVIGDLASRSTGLRAEIAIQSQHVDQPAYLTGLILRPLEPRLFMLTPSQSAVPAETTNVAAQGL